MPLFKKKRDEELDIGYPYPAQPDFGLPEPVMQEPLPTPRPLAPPQTRSPMPRPLTAQKMPMSSMQPEPLAPMPAFEDKGMIPPMPPMNEGFPELPEVSEKKAPVFVKLDEYQRALRSIGSIQDRVNELQDNVNRLKAVMSKEAEVVAAWNVLINDAKAKLTEINNILFEPKGA